MDTFVCVVYKSIFFFIKENSRRVWATNKLKGKEKIGEQMFARE